MSEPKEKAVVVDADEPESASRPMGDILFELMLPATMLVHLLIAPYTKVEESFNIQAIHDIATIGIPFDDVANSLKQFDHFEFPGVVPRSFTGAVLIGGLSSFLLDFVNDGLVHQILVRAILGSFNCFMMTLLSRRVATTYSPGAAKWYIVLQASQFHVMYYASRTLPNMFAFGMVTYALAELLPPPRSLEARKDWFDTGPIGLQILVLAAIVFRCEVGVLFITTLIPFVLAGWISIIPETIILCGATAAFGLTLAVPLDTFFWQTWPKPMWAEWEGFWFNTVQGKSSDWGTSPIYYYFVNAIPKMMLNPMALFVLLPLGVQAGGRGRTMQRVLGPHLAFVAVYSLLPHKEWRFIVYVMPALTLVSGVGADWLFGQRSRSILYKLANLALVASVLLSFVAAFGMSFISSLNYPGGHALRELQEMAKTRKDLNIHMDVKTCMTGATRFTQNNVMYPGWKYSKEEDHQKLAVPAFWENMDYAFSRSPGFIVEFFYPWEAKKTIMGYAGVGIWRKGDEGGEDHYFFGGRMLAGKLLGYTGGRWPVVKMEPAIWIVGKKEVEKREGFEDIELNAPEGDSKGHDEL